MILRLFLGGIFPCLYILHCFHLNIEIYFILFYFFCVCVRLHGTTKEAFVVDAIQLVLEHQLFIHHHVAKVVEVTTKYHTNMGIVFSSSSLEE